MVVQDLGCLGFMKGKVELVIYNQIGYGFSMPYGWD